MLWIGVLGKLGIGKLNFRKGQERKTGECEFLDMEY